MRNNSSNHEHTDRTTSRSLPQTAVTSLAPGEAASFQKVARALRTDRTVQGYGPAQVLDLQRTIGNQAVQRMISRTRQSQTAPAVIQRANNTEPMVKSPGPAPVAGGEEAALKEAFQKETFFYGTTGGPSVLKNAIEKLHKSKRDKMGAQAEINYWPGERAAGYLKGAGREGTATTNMMDNYYGSENLDMHKMRNPAIGKYLHQAMGYSGDYDHEMSGETAYKNTYGPKAGWDATGKHFEAKAAPQIEVDDKGNKTLKESTETKSYKDTRGREWEGLSGTMEISRYVRDGVAKYGGTIIFEGSTLTWDGSFVPGASQGDTNVEAEYMMPYFAREPDKSEVKFGTGKMVFHWKGQPAVPTRALFRTNWYYGQKPGTTVAEDSVNFSVNNKPLPANNLYWHFAEGSTASLKLPEKTTPSQVVEAGKADPTNADYLKLNALIGADMTALVKSKRETAMARNYALPRQMQEVINQKVKLDNELRGKLAAGKLDLDLKRVINFALDFRAEELVITNGIIKVFRLKSVTK